MYVSSVRSGTPEGGRSHHKISATVIGLGVVSLITDVSAEMVTAVLPLYLVYGLGVGYLQLGAIDGLYTGATALLRLAGGHVADRLQRPKAVALFGYGLSALTKLGFPLAGSSVAGVGLVIGVDRAGKGIRTGPRDAMITLATPQDALGRAFGVHRALDTAGALLGPLVAFGLLSLLFADYTSVFVVSFCFAVIAVVVLALFVRQPAGTAVRRPGLSWNVVRDRQVRRAILLTALLGVCTVGDMFLFVGVQKSAGLPAGVLPLLPLVTALTFMLAAAPVGKLADRVGGSKKEIRSLIEEIRAASNTTVMATEDGSKAVDAGTRQFSEVAVSFKQIVELVANTAQASREIELSTKQQTTAVEQVNAAIAEVARTARETEASLNQTLLTASELTTLSRDLTKLIQRQASAP